MEGRRTFRPGFHGAVFDYVEAFAELTDDAAILFVDQDNLPAMMRTGATHNISLAWFHLRRIIGWRLVSRKRLLARRKSGLGGLSAFQEGSTLCNDCLECIDIILYMFAIFNGRKLYPCERATVWAQIPSWYQVALGRLVVDLRSRR